MPDNPLKSVRGPLYADENALATVLVAALVDEHSTDIFDWDPTTIWMEVEDDYGVVAPPVVRSRTLALMTALSSDAPYRQWEVFEKLCTELNRPVTQFDVVDPPTPEELAWTVVELSLNGETPDGDWPRWSEEVRGYCRRILYDHGFYRVPDYLDFTRLNKRARSLESYDGVSQDEIEHEQKMREQRLQAYVLLQIERLEEQSAKYLGSTPPLVHPYSSTDSSPDRHLPDRHSGSRPDEQHLSQPSSLQAST